MPKCLYSKPIEQTPYSFAYLCYGESDEEDFGTMKELDQIVLNMEKNGYSK